MSSCAARSVACLLLLLAASASPARSEELSFHRWSGDLTVPDPVAVSLDPEGRVYVTQTQRRKSQDLDIRRNRDWIAHDVGFQSVEQKRRFYRDRLAPEHSAKNAHRVEDFNGDGSHDFRDLRVLSERIHRLEDTDGDGTADRMRVFAEDFRTEVTGITAGVLWHENAVYATIAPDVWKLRDTNADGVADTREVIATGFGLHIAYAGHDMHGLTVGPDGKIYWTIGDKGISVTAPDGTRHHYPNQGGVMRCNPDGSDFEVFAHGLRNVQELAFDESGNLFGVDNDADQPGEKERFVFIVQGMDAGWRCHYQYRGRGYNPWTAENLWKPFEVVGGAANRPYYAVTPVCNYEDGPCGLVYNPGTALGPGWERTFLMTEAPRGNQWAFQVEPDGASFRLRNSRRIGSGIPLIGWNFGPDGALYAADWGGGYPLNQKGAVWKIDVPGAASSPIRRETQELLAADFEMAETGPLQRFLGHPDQRVRLKAQFQLAERGRVRPFRKALEGTNQLARIHAVWGLGQLARAGNPPATEFLLPLLEERRSEMRVQAARTLADVPGNARIGSRLVPLLRAEDRRLQMHAALALASHPHPPAVEPLVTVLASLSGGRSDEPFLVHGVSSALAACASAESLARFRNHDSSLVRIAAVLALRRQRSPLVAAFLSSGNRTASEEAARAIHDDAGIPDALDELAVALSEPRHHSEAFIRRAINANLRIGHPEGASRVLQYARNDDAPSHLRHEALDALLSWSEPPVLDRVTGRFRDLGTRDPEPIAHALGGDLPGLFTAPGPALVQRAVKLATVLGRELDPDTLLTLLRNSNAPAELRVTALEALETPSAIDSALESDVVSLRIAALRLLAQSKPSRAILDLASRLEQSGSMEERQAALSLLAHLEADDVLQSNAARISTLPPALHLDLLEAAASRELSVSYPRDPSDPLASHRECLQGGDAERGRDVFVNHLAAQCVRCHKVDDSKGGSVIGPNLKNIGSKDRRYLLESLLLPSATITEGYGQMSVTRNDGTTVTGQFRKETGSHLHLRDVSKKKTIKVPNEEIATRSPLVSLMPPMTATLSKREIRDLVAYLATLKD